MRYLRRALDDLLDEVFPDVSAIAIEGAKAVGKTETARRRVQRVLELDDPHTLRALQADTDAILRGDQSLLIDEWQHFPPVWDRVRRMVDRHHDLAVLLTGSATPRPGTTSHSGAGRIATVVMRPMSLTERGVAPGGIDIAALLEGGAAIEGHSPLGLPDYVEEICASGLPGLRGMRPAAHRLQLDSYLARIVDRDLPEEGLTVRRPQALTDWLRAYAAASSTTASYTAILEAAASGQTDKPSRRTTESYRTLLNRIWVLDPVPGWTSSLAPLARLKVGPKHQLLDPALAARLLDLSPAKLLSGASGSTEVLGQLFESLVTLCVRVRAAVAGLKVSHLRTRNGDHEVDLIVENAAGRVVAIEVKLTRDPDDRDVRHLHWLGNQLGDRLADKVVVTTGEYAYRRDDGVAVVPLGLLA
ncbi:MAG: DUF4143 domain-containing protein [Propionibacteriaceae bacterium]|nr:DUF4143 domain-containing protein [Propionibacteriaceae bacterium]